MPKILTRLKVTEISAVDKGAGEGAKIMLMKRDDDFEAWRREQAQIAEEQTEEHMRRNGFAPTTGKYLKYFERHDDDGDVVATPPDKTSAEAADSFQGGGYVHHLADKVADMLIESGKFPDRGTALSFLMHNRDGIQLLRNMALTNKGLDNMDTVQLEAARAENLRKLGNDAVTIAKSIIEKETNLGLSQDDFVTIISNYDRKPGETEAQCFTRNYEANIELRKAVQVLKSLRPVMNFEVEVVDGPTVFQDALNDRSEAYDALVALASKMRARVPEMTEAKAFETVLQDPVNRDLATRALNPPPPPGQGGFPFPHTSSPGRRT
jgi:hypothetical protein